MQSNGAVGVIREARPSDLPQIMEVEQLCFPKQWNESQFCPALQDLFLVYEESGKVLGFIVVCSCEAARRAVIMRLAVHPQAQGRGIASRLLEQALVTLRDLNITTVELDVEIPKTNAKRLYEKFGFKTLKVVHVDADYENDAFYLMQLRFA
ncbi:MAG: GNAT family N-acetyltransferase [Desulfobacca sp.]|uniref:GNAT family N-acetyltransferase n=1 Tax=Desulfobacca sp. TaxID=2067990 RepID=UPI004048F705